jgi:hypothetical protein
MKFATTFAAMMIAGLTPLGAALEPASAEVFDWSLTGPAPDLGGVSFPGSGTITASPTASTGVFDIDTITGVIDGSEITGISAFRGADNEVFTNGFAFVSTVGISFETAAGQSVNISASSGRARRRPAMPMANSRRTPELLESAPLR